MRRSFLFLAALALLAFGQRPAYAAIAALDAAVAYSEEDSGSTLTQSYTASSGTNTLMVVHVWWYQCTASRTISTVAFGAQSLTIQTQGQITGGCQTGTGLAYLLSPTAGTANVVVTMSSGTNGIFMVIETFSGVSQTGQPDAAPSVFSDANIPTTFTNNITTVAANSLIVDVVQADAAPTGVSAGQTALGGGNQASYKIATTAGSYAMGHTGMTLNDEATQVIVSFSPAATTAIKTINDLAKASVKTANDLAIASVKNKNGLA